MPPRGLKTLLKKSAPGKLVGESRYKGYQVVRQGKLCGSKLKGITKLLDSRVYSNGTLPLIARKADPRPGGHWTGKNGGRSRGSKVDAQVSRIVNSGAAALKKITHCYTLTRLVFAALKAKNLEPVMAQRVVLSEARRIATAADILCYDTEKHRLVVVELKTGFDHGRRAAAETSDGKPCKMKPPLSKLADCNLNRHLCQLAVTRELFVREKDTLAKLAEMGLSTDVDGMLLYAADAGVEWFSLSDYFCKRAGKMIDALG